MTNMRPPSKTVLLKVVILGNGGVGKSCLMNRFVSNRYDEHNFHTIGVEFMNKDIEVDGVKYTLQIWDTAGQERFRALRTPFYRGSDICLLCYAVNDRDTLRALKLWHNEFLRYADVKAEKFPFIVVGNKNDMSARQRQVTQDEVLQWCNENFISSIIETSSKTAYNVNDAFELAVRQWKYLELEAENELRKQRDATIDLTKSIRIAQNRLCCAGGGGSVSVGSNNSADDMEDESMSTTSPSRFGRRAKKPQQTNYQL